MNLKTSEAIESCLSFLKETQENDGGFRSVVINRNHSEVSSTYTVFTPSLILLCLRSMESASAKGIIEKGVRFLLREKNQDWSFNYYKRSKVRSPYPNDLDDTSCALAALAVHYPEAIGGEALASFTKLLLKSEEKPGGPYRTWLISKKMKEWQDVDLGVNANISFFLSLKEISLAPLEAYIEKKIQKLSFGSKYYHSPLTLLYFISRAYKGKHKEKIIRYILSRKNEKGLWDTPLETILATIILQRLGAPVSAVRKPLALLRARAVKKEFASLPFYIEEKRKETLYSGSPSLTAALCAEALFLSMRKEEKGVPDNPILRKKIIEKASRRFSNTGKILSETAKAFFDAVDAGVPGHEITLLPFHFASLLRKKPDKKLLVDLGAANLLGWSAYRIYDDVYDGEGSLEHLAIANICLREMCSSYSSLIPPNGIPLFQAIMDDTDAANFNERVSRRIDQEIKASGLDRFSEKELTDKSMGHCLGPLTILLRSRYSIRSQPILSTLSFFRSYIAAKQLNDDAHDWLLDLKNGFINSSSALLVKKYMAQKKLKKVSLEALLHPDVVHELKGVFWNTTIKDIARDISICIEAAKKSLRENKALEKTDYLESLLLPLEASAAKALRERKQMKEFLKKYS